ncbi:MAG: hypothetical protein AAF762_00250 [Pseudomonadota bacterium]
MAVLDVIQDAAKYLGIAIPDQVFASDDVEAVELAEVANDAAAMISDEHDWQLLKRLWTITGDGAASAFDLPADWLRMPKAQDVWSSRLETPLTHALDHNEWLRLEVQAADVILNVWTVLEGQMAFRPAPEIGETIKLYYQSRLLANDGTANVEAFTADSDTFRLDDRLLKWGIVWTWKAQKGLAYVEDLAKFNDVLGRRIAEDKGAKMIAIGSRRLSSDARVSYPRSITVP